MVALLADDFLEFGRSGGVYLKEEVVRGLAVERDRQPSEFTAHGYELRALAVGVLLLTYRTTRRQESVPDLHTLRSSVWKLSIDRWQIAFHQEQPAHSSGFRYSQADRRGPTRQVSTDSKTPSHESTVSNLPKPIPLKPIASMNAAHLSGCVCAPARRSHPAPQLAGKLTPGSVGKR